MKFRGELQFELYSVLGWHWDCATDATAGDAPGFVPMLLLSLLNVLTDFQGSHANVSMLPLANKVSIFLC